MNNHVMKGVVGTIMCGGEGKRLRPLSYYFQKCMIPVGSLQKPLLGHIIMLFKKHEIIDVNLLVGYKHEQIVNYFNNGKRFGIKIDYYHDEPTFGGSGGALLNASRKGAFKGADILLVYYGDILSNIDLSSMLKQHVDMEMLVTLAITKGIEVPVGVAEVEDRNVEGWVEKPRLDICAGIGMMVMNVGVLDLLEKLAVDHDKIDLMGDLIPFLLSHDGGVGAYMTDAFWYDVGSTEKYEKLDNGLIDEVFKNMSK